MYGKGGLSCWDDLRPRAWGVGDLRLWELSVALREAGLMAGSAATNRPQTQSRWWPSSAKGPPDLRADVGHRDEHRASGRSWE